MELEDTEVPYSILVFDSIRFGTIQIGTIFDSLRSKQELLRYLRLRFLVLLRISTAKSVVRPQKRKHVLFDEAEWKWTSITHFPANKINNYIRLNLSHDSAESLSLALPLPYTKHTNTHISLPKSRLGNETNVGPLSRCCHGGMRRF